MKTIEYKHPVEQHVSLSNGLISNNTYNWYFFASEHYRLDYYHYSFIG